MAVTDIIMEFQKIMNLLEKILLKVIDIMKI